MTNFRMWFAIQCGLLGGVIGCLACGDSRPPIEMDEGIRPHFDRFMSLCEQHGTVRNQDKCTYAGEFLRSIKVVDQFEDNHPTVMAYCYREYTGNTIELRRKEWDALSFESKGRLLGHELGHCVLGLDHTRFGLMAEYFPSNEMPTDDLIIEAVRGN